MSIVKIGCGLLLLISAAAQAEDVNGIDRLNFSGDALKLDLSADASKPYKLNLEKRNWSDADCKVTVTRMGKDLTFQVKLNRPAGERCKLEVSGNVKPGKQVGVDLKAFDGDLNGQFAAVQLRGQALTVELKGAYGAVSMHGDAVKAEVRASVEELKAQGQAVNLAFDGSARGMTLDGQAVKAEVKLRGAQPAASVDVKGQMVNLDFSAGRQAKLDYQVSGQASKVSGDWANTPGAPLKLRVNGSAVKVSLERD
ncbi:hypothetical protein VL04_07755 [Chromobacterium violaceum]|uniref:hypothetical protein n=1 Tax=Chromobacterium violaceum TaxID=536 RepID=UPI0006549164|nr:hypothetical protein [Chromobacterium violaceum]KMN50266.1 hypothetical protein VK93_06985 [Chromobacterium violaceum]KMN87646.1 hypothetical protein VL02_02945 [Chromobacterium violaceum]KMN90733.1 hypothetical protein VL04_07755 [Chromobacterium violaceum]KMO03224.1 hypothetical protein VL16_15060 [Chromobacterium violaceum]